MPRGAMPPTCLPIPGPGAGGPRQDPGGRGRQNSLGVSYQRTPALGLAARRGLHRAICCQEDTPGLVRSVHPGVHRRGLRRGGRKDVHLQVGLGHGVERVLLLRTTQAPLVVRVAESSDVFGDEHAVRVHGPEVPLNMPEPHPAVQVGEAKAPAGYQHQQEGAGHVARYPQRSGQDPVHRPLGVVQACRARWHGVVDVVKGRDDVREDNTEAGRRW